MESSGSLDIIVDNNNDDDNNDDNNSSTAAMEAFPGDNDIKLGRGSGTNLHQGNKWFRSYVQSYLKQYEEMEKFEKGQLLLSIIDKIHDRGRRLCSKSTSNAEANIAEIVTGFVLILVWAKCKDTQ